MTDVLAQVDAWEPDVLAVGVTTADERVGVHGPIDEVLPFASVTKPLAAYAVLVAAKDGLLHLDEPAGPDGTEGITVRHLLAHAGGLPPDPEGPVTEPGRRRVYSSWGYDLLGDLVAERAGLPFPDHLDHEVLAPLGMTSTRLEGSPARDGVGTVADLLAFARELLAPTLVDEELVREATGVQFPGLDGVLPGYGRQSPNDWGLGFEIKDGKDPHWSGARLSPATFGHFGQSGSLFWVDPDHGLGFAQLADRPFGPWASEAWPAFTDEVVDAFAPRSS